MRRALAIATILLASSSLAVADDSAAERASLAGLTKLSVVVEQLGPTAEKNGLTTEVLESDVQQRFRKAGIATTPDADAYLYVHVKVADAGPTLPLPYVIDVQLMQEVTLPRGVKTLTPLQSPTWSLSTLGLTSPDRLRGSIAVRVSEFVDQFIAAYRSVNPKP